MSDDLESRLNTLSNFLDRLEVNHATVQIPNSRITLSGLQLAYELTYLKGFLLWESFQEEVFIRLLCGFHSNGGGEPMLNGTAYFRNLVQAKAALLGNRDYLLWHNPNGTLRISDRFFEQNGYFRQIIQINAAALSRYASVRHRIAHAQDHAENEFNAATMALAGRRYPGANPGRFLRDMPVGGNNRWIGQIFADLVGMAKQFC